MESDINSFNTDGMYTVRYLPGERFEARICKMNFEHGRGCGIVLTCFSEKKSGTFPTSWLKRSTVSCIKPFWNLKCCHFLSGICHFVGCFNQIMTCNTHRRLYGVSWKRIELKFICGLYSHKCRILLKACKEDCFRLTIRTPL